MLGFSFVNDYEVFLNYYSMSFYILLQGTSPMKRFKTLIFLSSLISSTAFSSEYEFDWRGRNDMRGAWFVCTPFAYIPGDCPDVLRRCWLPPMIFISCSGFKCRIKSHCLGLPSFFVSPSDVDRALRNARDRSEYFKGDVAPFYSDQFLPEIDAQPPFDEQPFDPNDPVHDPDFECGINTGRLCE